MKQLESGVWPICSRREHSRWAVLSAQCELGWRKDGLCVQGSALVMCAE
jgi:hypothetical protein